MLRRTTLLLSLAFLTPAAVSTIASARGFGGFHGGGGMGGFSGGAHMAGGFGGANFGGAGVGAGSLAGARGADLGGFGAGQFGGMNRANFAAGNLGARDFGAGNLGGGNFSNNLRAAYGAGNFTPGQFAGGVNRGQLNNFLGLPSDEGMHSLGSEFNVNHGSVEGPRGGEAAGVSVEGPRGNEAGRGVAVGPNGRVAGGEGVRGADGYGAGRGFVAGPNGAAAGFARVTPTNRFFAGRMVQGNFHDWGIYDRGWYAAHPGAWYAAGWAAGAAWASCTWPMINEWFAYPATVAPVYYDYGNSITANDGNVYVDGQSAGSTDQYYDQSATLAETGAQASASPDEQWLPLGVFALTHPDHDRSHITLQLAVDKQGTLRGNYLDSEKNSTLVVQGSVDKTTQRVAFTVGDKKDVVFETGLYSLTKDESPVLVQHKDHSEQWLLVRLHRPEDTGAADGGNDNTPAP